MDSIGYISFNKLKNFIVCIRWVSFHIYVGFITHAVFWLVPLTLEMHALLQAQKQTAIAERLQEDLQRALAENTSLQTK